MISSLNYKKTSYYSELKKSTEFRYLAPLVKLEALKESHKKGSRKHRSELVSSYIFDHQKDFKLLKKIAQIRDQGRSTSGEYIHSEIGSNFRTTDIQSAIGIEQLKKIESFLESRNKIATEYKKNLKDVSFQQIPNYVSRHSFMMFFAIAENQEMRNKHLDALKSNQIDARISWLPLNCQPINEKFSNNDYPESENIYNNSLTLPIYNLMTSDEIKFVLDSWS